MKMDTESISLSRFYEQIIENADSNLIILDAQFNIISMNQGFYWIFLEAYDIELKRGENLFELLGSKAGDIKDRWKKRCQAAIKGLTISDEEQFESDGQLFYWKIHYKSIRLGSTRYVSIFSRNVTANKLFQNRIIKHEANLRTIINSIPARIALINDEYQLIDFNESMYLYFLRSHHVQLHYNKKFADFFANDPDAGVMWLNRFEHARASLKPVSFLDRESHDGTEHIYETRIIPVENNNRFIGLTINSEDISQRRIDAQLQQTQVDELLKLNHELDRFVYSASHDLRAPLLSIIGIINLMKRESSSDRAYLQHIESSIRKLDNFVSNIINYSRNNRLEIESQKVDFFKLFDSIRHDLAYLEGASVVRWHEEISEDVPFYCDPDRLSIIIRNIISNSLQYFDPWKDSFLSIKVNVNSQHAIFTFQDNGVGIKEEFISKVFDMFFRASDRSRGSGLGLYIVKSAVEKLGGTVSLKSILGEGSTIELMLPNLNLNS